MVDDASLDEFLNGDDETGEDGDGARASDGGDAEALTASPDAVEPAVSTAAWTTDGAECASCGDVVERRWREGDGGLVCAACRDW